MSDQFLRIENLFSGKILIYKLALKDELRPELSLSRDALLNIPWNLHVRTRQQFYYMKPVNYFALWENRHVCGSPVAI